jgi:hypothetical protein
VQAPAAVRPDDRLRVATEDVAQRRADVEDGAVRPVPGQDVRRALGDQPEQRRLARLVPCVLRLLDERHGLSGQVVQRGQLHLVQVAGLQVEQHSEPSTRPSLSTRGAVA